jgi:biopolymer transport protein ExbD
MKFRTRELDDPRPDITPLVDVVFQLIIYFAVSTTFAIVGGFRIKLPQANAPQEVEKQERVSIEITAAGEISMDGRPVNSAELGSALKAEAAKNTKALVVIKADRLTSHGQVVSVMDLAQEAGLERLAIATERKAQAKEEEAPP